MFHARWLAPVCLLMAGFTAQVAAQHCGIGWGCGYSNYSCFSYGCGPLRYDCYTPCYDAGCYYPPPYVWSYRAFEFAPPPIFPDPLLFGAARGLNLPGNGLAALPNRAQPQDAAPAEQPPVRPRPSNAESLARAARYLTAGDDHFAAQRYRDANMRYRSATQSAPELSEAFFRQGQALLASGQHQLAGNAFKRGLRLGENWPEATFDLVELYGDNQVAKTAHLESVANAAADAPHDGTLLLLVGLQLYFGGQQERSLPLLRRAAELLDDEQLNLDAVLAPARDPI